MRYKALIIVLIFSILAGNAYAISLKVEITNSTKAQKMASYPFTLKISSTDSRKRSSKPKTLEFHTGPDGVFESEIGVMSGSAIAVEVNYRGINYVSQTRKVITGMENFSFVVPVYNITDKKENIAVTERIVTLVPRNEKVIQVYERLTIENSGNTTYVGKFNDELDLNQVLYIPMPRGYELTGLRGIPYSGIYTVSGGIVTKDDIKPGIHEVLISYHVLSDTGFYDFSLFTQKDAPEVRFFSLYFLKDEKWKINTGALKSAGDEQMGGKEFNSWKGLPGSVLRIEVYSPVYEGTAVRWGISIFIIFGILLTCLYLLRNPLKLWQIKREKKRLESILARIKERVGENEIRGNYQPFISIVRGRLKEIEQRLET